MTDDTAPTNITDETPEVTETSEADTLDRDRVEDILKTLIAIDNACKLQDASLRDLLVRLAHTQFGVQPSSVEA